VIGDKHIASGEVIDKTIFWLFFLVYSGVCHQAKSNHKSAFMRLLLPFSETSMRYCLDYSLIFDGFDQQVFR